MRERFSSPSSRRSDLDPTHAPPAPVPGRSSGAPPAPVPGRSSGAAPSGGGQALPAELRAKMEGSFGADFSAVRVHEGQASAALGAQAYAQGTDLHFAPGQYQPDSMRGQELIGHELAHVVQQSQGKVTATAQAKGVAVNADPGLEAEADAMGARAARGERASGGGPAVAARPGGGGGAAQCKLLAPVRDASAPVQCMKFRDNGKAISPFEDEPKDAHDTEQVDAFNSWLLSLKPGVRNAIYKALLEIGSPTRGEAIARSRIKQLQDSDGKQLGQANNALGDLRKDDWWKMFIDRGAHKSSEDRSKNAMRFDRESSPGYYDAMMYTYEQVLAPIVPGERDDISSEGLIKMHRMVTGGTLNKTEDTFEPTPHALSGEGTTFPMTKKEGQVPSAVAFEELAKEGVIGMHPGAKPGYQAPISDQDGPETRFRKRATQASPQTPMTHLRPLGNNLVDTNYDKGHAKDIMDHLLSTYYQERGEADKLENQTAHDNAKLRAIARVIRGLHTAHVFTDANGRLNTMVLLNKFLLEEGFDPAIMDDTSMFGGGFSIEQLVGQIRRGMTTFSQEARGGNESWGCARREYSWFTYAEDDHPSDIRVSLLHVIRLDVGKIPPKHEAKVAAIMKRFHAKAYSTTTRGATITRLGFKSSMDALLLENELETLTHD
jgi:hypothetical protein